MDIQQIKQLTSVDGWVDFIGTITEVKESKTRTKKNRLMQKVKISDATDEIGAWIYADEQMFTPNQTIVGNGMLKEYKEIRYIDYATVKLSQQQPQIPQQAPQQPTGQPTAKEEVDWDAKDMRNARMNALNNATAFVTTMATVNEAASTYLTREKIVEIAELFVSYIYNGIPKEKDDIPF